MALVVALTVADAVAVLVGVALADAVGVGDKVGVGDGVAHKARLVVQAAPSEGQQYLLEPQSAVVPTLAIVEQLIS